MDSQPIWDNTEHNCLFLLLGVEYWYLGYRTGYFYIPFPAGLPRQTLKNRRFDVMIDVLQNIQVPWDTTVLLGKQFPSWTAWPCRRQYDRPQNVKTSTAVCPAHHNSAIDFQFQHFTQFLFLCRGHCVFKLQLPWFEHASNIHIWRSPSAVNLDLSSGNKSGVWHRFYGATQGESTTQNRVNYQLFFWYLPSNSLRPLIRGLEL